VGETKDLGEEKTNTNLGDQNCLHLISLGGYCSEPTLEGREGMCVGIVGGRGGGTATNTWQKEKGISWTQDRWRNESNTCQEKKGEIGDLSKTLAWGDVSAAWGTGPSRLRGLFRISRHVAKTDGIVVDRQCYEKKISTVRQETIKGLSDKR